MAVIVGSSTCHLAQSREGVFGSGAAGCYPDATALGLYTLEAGQTATGSILDWYRRHFAGNQEREAEKRGVQRLPGARRTGRGRAAGLGRAGRPRRLAGKPISLQEPASPRGDRRVVAGPRPRPHLARHLRSDGLRHAPHPRGCHGPRPQGRADLSGRRRGQVRTLAPDPRRHSQEARPARPRERGLCPRLGDGRRRRRRHLSRLRPGRHAPWSPSSGSSSPTRPMRRFTTNSSQATSSCTAGSISQWARCDNHATQVGLSGCRSAFIRQMLDSSTSFFSPREVL